MSKRNFSRWPRLTRLPLALEIALALLLKLAILFALWHTFFSQPQARHMLLPVRQVEQQLLAGAASASVAAPHIANSTPYSPSQPKAQHGSH